MPYSVEDVYYNKVENLANTADVLSANCFIKCEKPNDAPFMSTTEGICFRNCMTKFSVFYPSLRANLVDAAFRFNEERTHKLLEKRSEDYRASTIDNWGGDEIYDRAKEIFPDKF